MTRGRILGTFKQVSLPLPLVPVAKPSFLSLSLFRLSYKAFDTLHANGFSIPLFQGHSGVVPAIAQEVRKTWGCSKRLTTAAGSTTSVRTTSQLETLGTDSATRGCTPGEELNSSYGKEITRRKSRTYRRH